MHRKPHITPSNPNISSIPASFFSNASASAPAFDSDSSPVILDGRYGSSTNGPIKCDITFGSDLDVHNCYNALRGVIDLRDELSYGDKGGGFDVQLPRRMSNFKLYFSPSYLIGHIDIR